MKTKKTGSIVSKNGRAYLKTLYKLAKVGKSVKKRLAFQIARLGGNVNISHAETDAEKLDILEFCVTDEIEN